MKILIGINTLTEINQTVYSNHLSLFYRLGRSYAEIEFGICAPRRMSIDNMRNFCAKAAIEGKFDYLWFIDDDVLLDQNALRHLLDLRSDISSGITLIRGYPYEPMLFSFKKGRKTPNLVEYKSLVRSDGSIRKLDAVGFSCCLIKVSLLAKIESPWFLTGPNFTEDVFFCNRARDVVKNVSISASNFVQTEHVLGSETICPANRIARIKYDEMNQPGIRRGSKRIRVNGVAPPKNADRFTMIRAGQLAEVFKANQ
jgi:hypothetical protein